MPSPSRPPGTNGFDNIRRYDHPRINDRRRAYDQPSVRVLTAPGATDFAEAARYDIPTTYDTTGLSLSGGGIRSAAVSIGAMQALESEKKFEKLDYISTVSGGGYAGISAVAAMSKTGVFPFGAKDDIRDNDHVGRLRNNSNYLLPRGTPVLQSLIYAAAVLIRGWTIIALVLLAILIPTALAVAWAFPGGASLYTTSLAAERLARLLGYCGVPPYGPALVAVAIALALALLSAVGPNSSRPGTLPTSDPWLRGAQGFLGAALILATVDSIPLMVALYRDLPHFLPVVLLVSTASTAAALFGGRLLRLITRDLDPSGQRLKKIAAKAGLVLAGALVPSVVLLLLVSFCSYFLQNAVTPHQTGSPRLDWVLTYTSNNPCIGFVATFLTSLVFLSLVGPNSYSLSSYYQERLAKAFMHCSCTSSCTDTPGSPTCEVSLAERKLSALARKNAPYLIVNASLNLGPASGANKRGRNATFFVFTPDYAGSETTGYIRTSCGNSPSLEARDPSFVAATAMAISAASVSSSMGRYTRGFFALSLALLNIRLGYWVQNPAVPEPETRFAKVCLKLSKPWAFFTESFRGHGDRGPLVYLTDGGHIENLGIYPLLKRGCRLIIAIDAEADPGYTFGALAHLERLARIDLGVRIDLPWQELARRCQGADAASASDRAEKRETLAGAHAAIGRIHYPDGQPPGLLLYIKSSLTGDERAYVLEYKKRWPRFPHERTTDQFFSEEQFEAYRALGFHMVKGALTDGNDIVWHAGDGGWTTLHEARRALRAAL